LAQHRQNIAQQAKKKAAAKQKEAQKREADHLSRKHLAGLRVRQRNLVYVTGLKPKVTGDKLVEGLRSKDFFGQYGEIIKVVVSKSNAQNQSVGVYVTFKNKEDAASCIQTIDGHKLPDGNRLRCVDSWALDCANSHRAQYGTTKYCSAYLRGDNCPNRNCMFLHEPGEDSESFTRQDLSSLNAISSQQVPSSSTPVPGPSQLPALPAPSNQDEEAVQSPLESPSAGPALPATASWGDQVRRLSRATTSASSPLAQNPMLASQQEKAPKDQPKQRKKEARPKKDKQEESLNPHFDDLLKKAFPPGMKFVYAHPPHFTEEDKWIVENMPPLFDLRIPRRKRELREREAADRLRQHQEAQTEAQGGSPFEADDGVDAAPGGSSQLGGEPEERGFSQSSVLSPQVIGSAHGHAQNVGMPEELSGLGSTRNPAPQATQHMLLQQLKSGSVAQGSPSNHGRQPSRYFLNEAPGAALKNYQKQPAPAQAQYSAQSPSAGGHFNYSSVQGPPPGLKTSGTPPVSGGGMFAQGHGFTQGFGRENDKFWELRGRAASGPDGKRELPFPYNQYPSTSAAGVLSFPYGSQAPAYPDPGPQKQKKKGKKHRHANTSSSGGGVVDVADPSILQMRVGSAMASQGYSAQGQGGFPSMHANAYRAW
jgi:CCR4-NOT transcription complex subunit 4